ncbi:MAG: DUF4340 domain-containing protein, partial [Pseudomonadota bacterium]
MTSPSKGLVPKERWLAVLATFTVLFFVASIIALGMREKAVQPAFEPAPMVPGLDVEAVKKITIKDSDQRIDVVQSEDGIWVLPDRDNFPARADLIQQTVIGLETTERVARKTARADWHTYIGLEHPDLGGEATLVELEGDGGEVLASVLLGPELGTNVVGGRQIRYARQASEDQTWLIETVLSPELTLGEWLETNFIDVSRFRVDRISIVPSGSAEYDVVAAEDGSFALAGMPEGKIVSASAGLTALAGSLVAVRFEDIEKSSNVDFSKPSQLTFRTLDGLVVDATVTHQEPDYWATFKARLDDERLAGVDALKADDTRPLSQRDKLKTAEAVRREVDVINRRAEGWAFRLPAFQGSRFMRELDELLVDGEPAGEGGL